MPVSGTDWDVQTMAGVWSARYQHIVYPPVIALFQGLHRDRSRLEKARVIKEAEMVERQARCNEIQVLKFGRLIDLEMVDKVMSARPLFPRGDA